ncbi:hypothetical protein ACIKT0_10960 [Hansschlegelia beijingensis]|uniref:hypothetical protein n=1 Tax=Hansschlegelia beijingensis TaxID=1133344 RepID=UPI00387F05B7
MSSKEPDAKLQLDKFRELARELGCDQSEERFDEALRKIGKAKPSKDEAGDQPDQGAVHKPSDDRRD